MRDIRFESCNAKLEGKGNWFVKGAVILLFPFTFSLSPAFAQEAIPASGGNASGTGGSVSYSVGQLFYTIGTGANGSVVPGVQQPYEISVVSGIEEGEGISLTCSVYPVPTIDFLTLKVERYETAHLSPFTFFLYDVNGKLLESREIVDSETTIDTRHQFPGIYFLKVVLGNTNIKTFKIIKH